MFLTKEQIIELTGRKRISSQLQWLIKHGWRFVKNANGRPIVLASYAESMLGLGCIQSQQAEAYKPNFDAIRKHF